jgi:hypothetical protein
LADARADEAHPAFQNLFVSAEWQAGHQALVFERKPRLASDKGMLATHFIAEAEPAVAGLKLQVDRQRWLGRNRGASHPLASFDEPPAAPEGGESAPLDTGLDPVAAFALRLQLEPGGQARVTFCTAAANSRATLRAVIDKYRQPNHVERASMMSATLAGIRLRDMRIGAETFSAIQTLTTLVAMTLTRPHALRAQASEACDRRRLWRFGISGDRPIVLVSAGAAQGFGLLRSLAQGLRLWSWGGVACDLVVVNHEPASYLMELARQIGSLRDAHIAACNAQPCAAETGFFILAASDLHGDELSTLRALARVRLNADGRPLAHHVQELVEEHDRALEDRQAVSTASLPADMGAEIVPRSLPGDFAQTSGEFRFDDVALTKEARRLASGSHPRGQRARRRIHHFFVRDAQHILPMLQTYMIRKQAAGSEIAPAKRRRYNHNVRHQHKCQHGNEHRMRKDSSNSDLLFRGQALHIFTCFLVNLRFIHARKPTRMKSKVAIALARPKFVPESRKAILNVYVTSKSVSPAFPPTICGPPPVRRKIRLKLLKLKAKDEIRIGIIAGRTNGRVR